MLVSGGGTKASQFSQQNLAPHGPSHDHDPSHPIITPLREAIRHLQRCRLEKGVVLLGKRRRIFSIYHREEHTKKKTRNHQQIYVSEFMKEFGGLGMAWGMLKGMLGVS